MGFEIRKVVNQLPATLEPNTLYAVRSGTGFRLVCTNNTGSVGYVHNQIVEVTWANRWTMYQNGNWTSFGVNRGHREQNQTTQAGGAADPTINHQIIGPVVRLGQRLINFQFSGTVNNGQVTGVEYVLYHQYGPFGSWNSAASTTRVELARGTIGNNGTGQQFRSAVIDLDYTVGNQGYVVMYARRGGGVLTANRFARLSCRIVTEQFQIV